MRAPTGSIVLAGHAAPSAYDRRWFRAAPAAALCLGITILFLPPANAASLDTNLNRLFETWRARNYPGYDSCTAWRDLLDESQRMVFLTITHRLTTSRLAPVSVAPTAVYYPLYEAYVPDGQTPLDHIAAVYSIAGGHGPQRGSGVGSCGGGDNNRLFVSMDRNLWLALGLANATSGSVGNPGPLLDRWNNRNWRESQDIAGPHDPFTVSDETTYGSPRGQVHFWLPRTNPERTAYVIPVEPASGPVWRPGVGGIDDPYMLEMDQDYNWTHESNPLCSDYLNDYVANHGAAGPDYIDLDWEPAACAPPPPGPAGYQGCFTDDSNRALPVFLGQDHTIDSCIAASSGQGYAYAGLQFWGQCWAGNTLGYMRVGEHECDTPCQANPTQMCGGTWRNSIYATGSGGPPPPPPPGGSDILSPDQSLNPGDVLHSADGRFHFTYQGDGNLVLYQDGVGAIWASHTAGTAAGRATMQGDGHFVIYDAGGQPVWASGTAGNPGAYLKVQVDGNVVVYHPGGAALWYTGTCCQ